MPLHNSFDCELRSRLHGVANTQNSYIFARWCLRQIRNLTVSKQKTDNVRSPRSGVRKVICRFGIAGKCWLATWASNPDPTHNHALPNYPGRSSGCDTINFSNLTFRSPIWTYKYRFKLSIIVSQHYTRSVINSVVSFIKWGSIRCGCGCGIWSKYADWRGLKILGSAHL